MREMSRIKGSCDQGASHRDPDGQAEDAVDHQSGHVEQATIGNTGSQPVGRCPVDAGGLEVGRR